MKTALSIALASLLVAGSAFGQKFKTFSYGEDERHELDVYPQAKETAAPVVIFVHGGGWTVGRKSQYRYMGKMFQKRGITFVAVNYRLYPKAKFPAYPRDAASAVAWVSQNIADHGGDPAKIFLMGHSAGAHSVALLGMEKQYMEAVDFAETAKILGVVAISGPMNLNDRQMKVVKKLLGNSEPDSFRPTKFIAGGAAMAPPFLLLHGENDPLVSVNQSKEFEAEILKHGGLAKGIYYPKHDHITIIGAFAEKFEKIGKVIEPVVQFVESGGNLGVPE